MYLERLSARGISQSKYYQTKTFNKGLHTDNDLPNCVQYDVCRTYEACEVNKPFIMFKDRSAGGYPDAENWYNDTILPKGKDVKTGSIVCFDNHVAFVERVNKSGTCLITDSRYDTNKDLRNDRYWRKLDGIELKIGQKPNITGIGKVLGFIYLPIKDVRVNRDTSKEQIELIEDYVNVRKSPNGDLVCDGCFAPKGIFNVISKQNLDGYIWYEIDTNCFVRSGEWLLHYDIEQSNDELLKEIEELKNRLKKINELSEV